MRARGLALDIFAQPILSKLQRAPFSVPVSDAEADIVTFIERQTGTNYHPTCTCAIGRVVDTDLRVIDTEGLRVVDASVMPSVVRGNTNAAVIAIAEKAADILIGIRSPRSAMIKSALAQEASVQAEGHGIVLAGNKKGGHEGDSENPASGTKDFRSRQYPHV
jgi:choline dehydrogenase-like flavoprotein